MRVTVVIQKSGVRELSWALLILILCTEEIKTYLL